MMQPAHLARARSDSQAAWSGVAPTRVATAGKQAAAPLPTMGALDDVHMSRLRMTKRRAADLVSLLPRAHQVSTGTRFARARIFTDHVTDKDHRRVRNSDTDVIFGARSTKRSKIVRR
jgi:hypothetical protein